MGDQRSESAGEDEVACVPSWRIYLPVMLLVAVASVQFIGAQFGEISAWRGGGFGMYSTYHPRTYSVWTVDPERQSERRLSNSDTIDWANLQRSPGCGFLEEVERCRRLPSERCLRAATTCLDNQKLIDAGLSDTRLELWRLDYDPRSSRLGRLRVASVGLVADNEEHEQDSANRGAPDVRAGGPDE